MAGRAIIEGMGGTEGRRAKATHMHAVEAFMESASEGAKRRYEASADPAQVAQIVRRRSLDMSGQPVPWSEDVQ